MSEFIPSPASAAPTQSETALAMFRSFEADYEAGRLPRDVIEQVKTLQAEIVDPVKASWEESQPRIEIAVREAETGAEHARELILDPGHDPIEARELLVELDDQTSAAAALADDSQAEVMRAQLDFQRQYLELKANYIRDTLGIEDGSDADQALSGALQPTLDEVEAIDAELDSTLDRLHDERSEHHAELEADLADAHARAETASASDSAESMETVE